MKQEKPIELFNGCTDIEWLKQFQAYCETHSPVDEDLQLSNKRIIKGAAEKIQELEQAQADK